MFQINTPYFVTPGHEERIFENIEKPNSKYENSINTILIENNQLRKIIPEGDLQILKALSYALFFTTYFQNAIQTSCNQYLLTLIRYNNLNDKLHIFKNNMLLFRDFSRNPCENQTFERVETVFL